MNDEIKDYFKQTWKYHKNVNTPQITYTDASLSKQIGTTHKHKSHAHYMLNFLVEEKHLFVISKLYNILYII